MRKISIVICLSLCFTVNSFAQYGTGANFLKLGVGARQMGLGSAFTGVGDDLYSIYWNPAGLGQVRWWEISAMYNNYFADMYYGALTGVKQFRILGSRKTTAGLGLFFHGMPDWDATEGQDTEAGKANNIMAIASFGQRLDWLTEDISLGLNVKFGRNTLANYHAWTIASDFGILYRLPFLNKSFTAGAAVQNIGFQTAFIDEASPIPLGYRFGLSYRFINCDYHHLLLATDIAKYKYGDFKFALGAEYWFRNLVAIRGGYVINKEDIGDLSFGMSIRMDALNSGLQADYSQSDYGEALGYNMNGAISLNSVNPEPFRLFSPNSGHIFCYGKPAMLYWENAPDPDHCDIVTYRVLIDPSEEQIIKSAKEVCDSPENKAHSFLDLSTNDTEIQIPDCKPDNYFWTIVAVDRNGHSRWSNEIRSFIKSAPDLIIRELAFSPSDTLPDFHDNYQGVIKVVVENPGYCTGYDFQIALRDSFCCNYQNIPLDTLKIDSIGPGETINRYVAWHSDMVGKHYIISVLDFENSVFELNEANNNNF